MGSARLRVLFIGTDSTFSRLHLEALAAHHDVVAILHSVRRGRGWRGWLNRYGPSGLRSFARSRAIPFAQADRSQLEVVRTLCDRAKPEIGCVAGMSCLLPARLLAVPPLGFVNVHPATLPAWRGPMPVFWQLLDGCEQIGVTVHRLAAGEDDGPILRQGIVPVAPAIAHTDLMATIGAMGAALLLEALAAIRREDAVATAQPWQSPTARARKVGPADAGLLCRADEPIERTARAIAALGEFVALPRPRLRDLGRLARVTGCRRNAFGEKSAVQAHEVGRRCHDRQGPFLVHREGRIDLVRDWRPRGWVEALLACRRAGIGWKELI